MASAPFDARPLIEPVDKARVREFARRLRAAGAVPASSGGAPLIVFGVLVAVFLVTFVAVVGGVLGPAIVGVAGGGAAATAAAVLLPFVGFLIVFTAVGIALARGWLVSGERWYRLDGFARANGLTYVPRVAPRMLPGMIFRVGHAQRATDVVRGERPRFVEFGNYRYATGSGRNQSTHRWGYVAVRLDAPLPHIVLDARSNDTLFGSTLPSTFDRDQRLSLEGDFDEHFALYCPTGYERDALYLFTPDIMARFIDNAAALDVEIVDDWLFLYARRDFSTLDPATWAWLFAVVGALLDKLAQWARWRDERLPADAAMAEVGAGATWATAPVTTAVPSAVGSAPRLPPVGVARGGRRLRRGVPWAAIVAFGVVIALWIFSRLGGWALFGGVLDEIFTP